MKRSVLIFLAAALPAGVHSAKAQAPDKPSVAVIADLSGDVRWASKRKGRPDLLDELYEGDRLSAAKGAKVVLVYYSDCRRETIVGPATVGAGDKASDVAGGKNKVRAARTNCERRKAVLPSNSGRSAQGLVVARLPDSARYDAEKKTADAGYAAEASGGAPARSEGALMGKASARGKPGKQAAAAAGGFSALPADSLAPAASAPRAELSEAAADMQEQSDDERERYKRAVNKTPRDPAARLAYAVYLENRGELEAALAQYEIVLKSRKHSAALKRHCKELRAKIASAQE